MLFAKPLHEQEKWVQLIFLQKEMLRSESVNNLLTSIPALPVLKNNKFIIIYP